MRENYKKGKKIIENFIYEYFRTPSYREFINIGGDLSYYYFYKLRKEMGFNETKGRKMTYEVLNRKGEILFVGSSSEIAEEFDTTPHNVATVCKKNLKLKRKYTLRKKVV